jgi:hypothetical protein
MTRWIAALLGAALSGSVSALAATTPAAPAAPAGKIAPKDIEATFFTGQPFTAATPANVKFKMVFTPDGKAAREPLGKSGSKGQGTWKLNNDGFCTAWSGGRANCYTLVARGSNKWSVMSGTTLAAIWSK